MPLDVAINASSHTEMPPRFQKNSLFLPVLVLMVVWAGAIAARAGEIRAPFGLEFGQSSAAVREALDKAGARVSGTAMVDGNPTWTVNNIKQPGLDCAVFTFRGEELAAVELQYRHPDWTSSRYHSFMAKVKENIESKYGDGVLITRSQSKGEDGILQTVMGYEWRRGDAMIQLFYYSATRPGDAFYSVSIHYKAL